MAVSNRLQTLRRARGWSQETLAEHLGISRQAVSQWESAQAVPELDNLVGLADLFQVSLDDLVRDRGACSGATSSVPPPEADAVVAFLLRAKRATYAGHGAEVPASRLQSHDLSYAEGSFTYYDTYLGSSSFSGQEALWDEGTPFWSMNYVGRLVGEGFSGDFLKECLALVSPDRPFRGPAVHQNGDFLYHCAVQGDFSWFLGDEAIYLRGHRIYECRFHGGTVRG